MEKEEWRDIPGYEGLYQVSSLGLVKSLSRKVYDRPSGFRVQKDKILKPRLRGDGKLYYAVTLYKKATHKTIAIHILVADAFIGIDSTKVTDHINNDPLDNRLCNLQRITQRENVSKKVVNKTSKYVGVCWHKGKRKWDANICIKGKDIFIGRFDDEYQASLAYQSELEKLKSKTI